MLRLFIVFVGVISLSGAVALGETTLVSPARRPSKMLKPARTKKRTPDSEKGTGMKPAPEKTSAPKRR